MHIYILFAIFVFLLLTNSTFAKFATTAPDKEPDRTTTEIIIYFATLPIAIFFAVNGKIVTSIEQLLPAAFIAGTAVIIYDIIITLVDIYRLGKKDSRWRIYKFNRFCMTVSGVITGILIAFNAGPIALVTVGISSFFFCMVYG